ncbi:MAG: DEAD/DEAH box helicase [Candidatus Bathyarchaeia archaeon]|nr:DEAD/DEAH box helicase [Candidatus Bathyarchaeota archaeon]
MLIDELDIHPEAKRVLLEEGIRELFPPQEEAIKIGALKGVNLVLASPTASGKTLIAELCAIKHILENGGKVLYLTPLRALANEKYEDFKKYSGIRKPDGRNISVGISTGDYDSSDPWLGRYDIIVTTNEKFDSLLRHRAPWISDISLVIADEVHLLNDVERGPTLEVVLARLSQINPGIQVLALSATIRNVNEIAEWLNARAVTTEWRPVKLREGILYGDEIQFKDGGSIKIDRVVKDPVINLAVHCVKQGGQALIFASSRKNAVSIARRASPEISQLLPKSLKRSLENLAEEIQASGERTRLGDALAELVKSGVAFHHAGLSGAHRKIIEDAFRDGRIKVLTATPTLAFGVNLPARMVIISDYRRYEPGYGYYPITVLEYKQMVGRAGRPKYDRVGEAILIAKSEDERDYLLTSYVYAKPERIWSKLGVERVLRSHVLATIASGFAYSEQGVYDFFSKTLYAYQYNLDAIKGAINRVLKFLHDEDMIRAEGVFLKATEFGVRVSQLYIDPLSAIIIRDALKRGAPKITDISFLHMIAHTPDMSPKIRPTSGDIDRITLFLDEHRDEFMFNVPDEWGDRIEYEEFLGEVKTAMVLKAWIEEYSEDQIIELFGVEPGDLYYLTETAKWLLYSSYELAKLLGHKNLLPKLAELMERVEHGVKAELLPLARLEGVGRVRARILYNAGLRTIEDLKRASVERLMSLPHIGPKIAKRIKEQVGGTLTQEEWRKLAEAASRQEQQPLTEYYGGESSST